MIDTETTKTAPKTWSEPAPRSSIDRTIAALAANGIEAFRVANGQEARQRVLDLIPAGAEVFTAGSMTLDAIGLAPTLNESGKYDGVKARLMKMDKEKEGRAMRKLGAGPDFAVGSAHALTETGSIIAASLTGSQLPSYAFGAGTVIWVIGAQKIVKDVEEGLRRIWDYVLPLESVRARKAYGLPDTFNSYPSKILIFNREIQPGRAKVIIVEEAIGF